MTDAILCEGPRWCATCDDVESAEQPWEEAHYCPDLNWLCPACSDGHTATCTTCRGIAREDHEADMADARRKGEW